MSFKYPLDATRALAQRVDQVPAGASHRRWVLRDDNERHYHAVVRVSDSPVYVELLWKANSRGREQEIGLFRLDLAALLAEGYIRFERESAPDDDLRLRFYRGDRGVVYIQSRAESPALAIGTVDQAS